MYMPRLESEQTRKDVQIEFRGYNHNLYCGENEFYDQENMTGRYWPVLSPRGPVYQYVNGGEPEDAFTSLQGMAGDGNGNILTVDNNQVYYNGASVGTIEYLFCKRTLVPYAGYVAIFPDKYLYNWKTNSLEQMEVSMRPSSSQWIKFDLVAEDGSTITASVSQTAPASPSDGAYWVDTSITPNTLKRWSAYNSKWLLEETTFMGMTVVGGVWDWGFSSGDEVVLTNTISDFNGTRTIYKATERQLIFEGITTGLTTIAGGNATVKRTVPDMDFVCAHDNRLWGCSNYSHEIYSSKLGDPKNWRAYAGISTDSYALTIPEETFFTGCYSYRGSVLFFKEDKIYKIFGTKPSNYQLSEVSCAGVCRDGSGSLCSVNEMLYYAANDGIYAYDGSIPRLISTGIDRDWIIKEASGGTDGKRYFVFAKSVYENKNEWDNSIFEYDPRSGMFSRNDDAYAWNFVKYTPGVMAFIKEDPIFEDGERLVASSNVSSSATVPFTVTGSPSTIVDNDPRLVGRKVNINGVKRTILSNTTTQYTLDGIVSQVIWQPVDEVERVLCFTKQGLEAADDFEYTIKAGDTLSSIALAFGTTAEYLAEYNGIPNPDMIIIGEKIKIPFGQIHNDLPSDAPVSWFSETGDIAYYDTNRRYISKIQVRTELEQGSTFKVALRYDHGTWEDVYTQTAPSAPSDRKTYVIPIIPHRCDTVRMKFYGTGGCKIFAVSKHYEQGSEI